MNGSVGSHYQDRAGEAYFRWQKSVGEIGGLLNADKFSSFVTPGSSIVDFGCGTGALLEQLHCQVKLGIEPNDAARRNAEVRGIDTVASPSEVKDDFADVVISNHALEHALNPYLELIELKRILRPGGILVIFVPLDDFRSQPSFDEDLNHHLYTWTPLLLRNILTEAGFEVESCDVITQAWPPGVKWLSRLPSPIFKAMCSMWSVLRRRRQIRAIAR